MKIVPLIFFLLISLTSNSQNIDREAALADFDEFIGLLKTQSSYFQVSDYDFNSHFQSVRERISTQDSVSIPFLAYQMEKIIAETVDRHASVKMEDFEEGDIELFNLHFPFALAPLNGKVVALVRSQSTKGYELYSSDYPYVQRINNIPTMEFIEEYAYRRKNSPTEAKLYDAAKDLRDIGELFFKQGEQDVKELDIVLTNGESSKEITLPLSKKKYKWNNIGHLQDVEILKAIYFDEPFDYQKLDKWLEDSIAYLHLPSMFSYDDFPGLESHLQNAMNRFMHAKALVIDVRGNGGGSRNILNTLAGYIVPPEQSPWVANVAYIRNDQQLDEDIESMSGRFLYSYYSDRLTDDDRKAIDLFMKDFNIKTPFDAGKFSEPFYMVLKSNDTPLTCPIYVLADERSFSAASVFTATLKGLTNVKIVGITTNGSSGRSRKFHLANSNIRIKLSTMISIQRNGYFLDGYGTKPDIVIDRSELQVLGKRDSQLDDLVELIKRN